MARYQVKDIVQTKKEKTVGFIVSIAYNFDEPTTYQLLDLETLCLHPLDLKEDELEGVASGNVFKYLKPNAYLVRKKSEWVAASEKMAMSRDEWMGEVGQFTFNNEGELVASNIPSNSFDSISYIHNIQQINRLFT